MSKVILVLVLLAACTAVIDNTVEPEDLSSVAETYCKAHPELPCGHVFVCDTPAENELGQVEICIPQFIDKSAAEAIYGACEPTPRHSGLCWFCCGEGCTAGCNALSGCFCPPPQETP